MHRRATAVAALALAALPFLGSPGRAQPQSHLDFKLVNRTGYQIDQVFVGRSDSTSWENDVLGRRVLSDGRFLNIRFNPNSRSCHWDLKVIYNDGDQGQWSRLNLSNISQVTLYWNRRNGTTRAVTE
ncbi:hypothetical protein [Roseomonas xinghualingensis]|uniref:hypothetical protein n=1 Tax=Roseomonas xinghualingensis TaxID=2986475 RepID=UPI0021F0F07F|nr:hypothetical protein [Roseomonas sp. SXEYE001]MCV4210092.1 hypothetical protein [Roseomonas sp. SXEYE001]